MRVSLAEAMKMYLGHRPSDAPVAQMPAPIIIPPREGRGAVAARRVA